MVLLQNIVITEFSLQAKACRKLKLNALFFVLNFLGSSVKAFGSCNTVLFYFHTKSQVVKKKKKKKKK